MRRILSIIMLLFATLGALADINITNVQVATNGYGTGDKMLGVTNSTHTALMEIKFLNELARAYLLGSSNAYLGSFTGNGAGLTNLPGGLATNVPVLVAGTNIWIDVNGLTNTISTLDGIATTNYVGTYYYLQSNPSNFVTASITNGLAPTNYVGTYYYLQSNPSNFVTATITNGLATTNYVGTYYYLQSNPSNYVTASVTNGLATTNYVGTYYYLVSNPSNYVTASVTNGLATTNWVGDNFWQTNESVPFDIYTNSSGALSNPLSATALAFQQGYGISRTWTVSNNIAITTASIDTNTVITTNGGTFVGQILDNSVSSDSPAANQLVKASWVRGLFSGGTFLYNITNAHPVDSTWYIASDTTNSSAQVRTYAGVTNNQYLGTGIMSTQAFTTVYSPMTVNAYLSFNSGGAKAVSVKPEFYYVYTNLATNAVSNLLGDYDCGPQALSAGTNLYSFVVSFPTVSSTNPFFVVRRFKVTSQNLNPDVSIHGSGSTPSHISFSTPPASQVASSVYASNVISGGVLPAGTVSSTSLTPGYALGNDGSVRIWTNSLNGVSIGGNAATATTASYVSGTLTNSITGNAASATTVLALGTPVENYGAYGDALEITNAWMTNATMLLVCSNATFTSGDTGKVCMVIGAGVSGAALSTFITQYVSSTSVMLSNAASTTVTNTPVIYGHDDTSAFQSGLNQITNGSFTLYAAAKGYIINGALQDPGSTGHKNAQLILPDISSNQNWGPTITIMGKENPAQIFIVSSAQNGWVNPGTTIFSTLVPASCGGSFFNPMNATTPGYSYFNPVQVRLKNIAIQLPPNPSLAGLNLGYAANAVCENVGVTTGYAEYSFGPRPTCVTSTGILMPLVNNAGSGASHLLACYVYGFFTGIELSEHDTVFEACVVGCNRGVTFNASNLGIPVFDINIEGCKTNFYASGAAKVAVYGATVEHDNSSVVSTVYDLYDPNGLLSGYIYWAACRQGVGDTNEWTETKGTNLLTARWGTAPYASYSGSFTGNGYGLTNILPNGSLSRSIDATATNLATIYLPTNFSCYISGHFLAVGSTNGSNHVMGETLSAAFNNSNGVISAVGDPFTNTHIGAAWYGAYTASSPTNVLVQGIGDANESVGWVWTNASIAMLTNPTQWTPPPPFAPNQITGVYFGYDGEHYSTNGSSKPVFADQSGNGLDLVSTWTAGAKHPTTGTQNLHQVTFWNAAGQAGGPLFRTAVTAVSTPLDIFVVACITNTGGSYAFWEGSSSETAYAKWRSAQVDLLAAASWKNCSLSSSPTNAWHTFEFLFSADGSITVRLDNGSSSTSTTGTPGTFDRLDIGETYTGADIFNGAFAELWGYTNVVDASNRTSLTNYFRTKYGY